MRSFNTPAAKGWEELCRQVPANIARAWAEIRVEPQPFPGSGRHHRLKGQLSTENGLDQWQYEVTGGGRIWYLVDPDEQTVWITYAGTTHPKATD
jgi:CubicO group peptidase (beta-lactamase class C family)